MGTRGSALALVQAEMTEKLLGIAYSNTEVVRNVIKTTGDLRTDVPLSQVAKVEGVLDKGVFTKELEIALEAKEVDIAVHSLKDVPTVLPEGFKISAVLERAPVGDILISKQTGGLKSLPEGAKVGTSSVRRQRMIQWIRPDLVCVDIRGNVPTRLRKLAESEDFDAIILAEAGLVRLGYDAYGEMKTEAGSVYGELLDSSEFLPAAGQGAVGIEVFECKDDSARNLAIEEVLQGINHAETFTRVTAEREFLRLLDAGCHTPVGVSTQFFGDKLMMEAIVFDEEGHQEPKTAEVAGDKNAPKDVALKLYQSLS